jgi:hypothetical protein
VVPAVPVVVPDPVDPAAPNEKFTRG